MTQSEFDFIREACIAKVDKLLGEVLNNANTVVDMAKKEKEEKPKETKSKEEKK